MTNNRWVKMFDTKNYTYWKQQDESGMDYYNVSVIGEPMEIEAGGYYNIESLAILKNDSGEAERLAGAIYNTLEQVEIAVKNSDWFKYLWENPDATMYDYYPLYKQIRFCSGLSKGKSETSEKQLFNKGWQYRNVLQDDYNNAVIEFCNLIIGWW